MNITRAHARLRAWMRTLAAVATVGAMHPAHSAAPVPVESFFEMPEISEATISPTGRHVALVTQNKDGRNQLVVVDTATLKPFVAAASGGRDVGRVRWVNEKRLVYSVSEVMSERVSYPGLGSLFAVDLDGREHRPVISVPGFFGGGSFRIGYTPYYFARTWMADSDDVFVAYPQADAHWEVASSVLKKVNTRTGETTALEGPAKALFWSMGPGDRPRAAITREGGDTLGLHVLDPATGAWEKHRSWDTKSSDAEISVLGFAGEGTLYVAHQPKSADAAGLYTYDIKARSLSAEPIASAKGFDVEPAIIRSGDRVVGLRIETDARTTVWFDPAMKQAQARLDALLRGTVNEIEVPLRPQTGAVLVHSYSDVDPGRWLLYDLQTGKLVELGRTRPHVDPAQMASRDFVRIKARDGLDLPVWVTLPRDGGKQPRPAVVLVHGGPWVRGGHWSWDADTQFLASRGYAVIEPEFRGSTGFGNQHFRAGWKQWGLAMQDDVADATRWAIEKGIADPKRICIAGASYGGYAALMGLVKDPGLYRCGIEWVGVTDVELMYSISWSDTSDTSKRHSLPLMIGDPQQDTAQLRQTSPLQQAARITQPLLLGYGGLDDRVPLKHGTEFRDAVEKTNHAVEWVVYPDEYHGWHLLKDNVDWWTRVEKFLARNIGDKEPR